MNRTLCAMAVAVALVLTPDAWARPSQDRVVIQTSGVDVSTEAGARTILRRLDRAADIVCGKHIARRYLTGSREFRRCHELTVAAAVGRIGSPTLHALHSLRPHI